MKTHRLCRCPLRPLTHELTPDCDPSPDELVERKPPAPPIHVIDKRFRYVDAAKTDIRQTFARIRDKVPA